MDIELTQIVAQISTIVRPLSRVVGLMLVAPLFSAMVVPLRIRAAMALVLSAALAPLVPDAAPISPFEISGVVVIVQQMAIGAAIGFLVKLVFESIGAGGQLIALSMGLSYADVVDPEQGKEVSALSQYYTLLATLLFLAMDGHLSLLALLADSFQALPLNDSTFDRAVFWSIAVWGGQIFAGAVKAALPAIAGLLVVNLGFGAMSRAAPSLNLFAVGVPLTVSLGFVVVWLSMRGLPVVVSGLLDSTFALLRELLHIGP